MSNLIEESVKRRRESLETEINQERVKLGKNPIELKDEIERKEIKSSLTDPESGYYHRSRKDEGCMYLDHRTVDDKYYLIVDAFITKGNVHDSQPYLGRLDYIEDKYQIRPEGVGLESGYYGYEIIEGLEATGIYGFIGYRRFGRSKSEQKQLHKVFEYDTERDVYICPLGAVFPLKNVNKQGYKIYHKKENCDGCAMAQQCLKGKDKVEIRHNIKQPVYDSSRQKRLDPLGKKSMLDVKKPLNEALQIANRIMDTGMLRIGGLNKVQANVWLSCAAQNMKKIALIMANRARIQKDREQKELVSSKLCGSWHQLVKVVNQMKSHSNYEVTLSTV